MDDMFIVYVLRSMSHNLRYTGFTQDLERRLKEHNNGQSTFTSKYKPWEVIYTEKALNRQDARRREKYLKSAAGKRFIDKALG
jgi:putative endonuclease